MSEYKKWDIASLTYFVNKIKAYVNTQLSSYYNKTSIDTKFSNLSTVATSGSYNDLADKPTIPTNTSVSVMLNSGSWSGGLQTVNVTGVKTSSKLIISPDPASIEDYVGVYALTQGVGNVTFICGDNVPTNNILVNILIVG